MDRAHLVAAEQRNAAGQAREEAATLRGRLAAFEGMATSPTPAKTNPGKPRAAKGLAKCIKPQFVVYLLYACCR
ncbi:hypothetical protein GUG42_12635 [Xanthomonas citri pv. citri]|nr:hypothetical protein [Xanthomonas citri pv. citri]